VSRLFCRDCENDINPATDENKQRELSLYTANHSKGTIKDVDSAFQIGHFVGQAGDADGKTERRIKAGGGYRDRTWLDIGRLGRDGEKPNQKQIRSVNSCRSLTTSADVGR
jgi:hypothetical protein